MQQQSLPDQPETSWYKGRLKKIRLLRLLTGILLLCLILSFFIGTLFRSPFRDIPSLVVFVVFSLLMSGFAVSEIMTNWGPVPVEAINQLRQHERSLLFQQAQGALPWQYRLWVRGLELLLAAFSFELAAGHTILVMPERAQWVIGGVYFLAGLGLLADIFYFKPKQARQLATKSASELSFRLSSGEATGENHSDSDM
ncbi:hypothetical protein EPA93_05635 [Ktedonosporobacter rubrisoli]|uniref:Uncharacterized protein n=1 Tax=Ktedonosporobacter rubrisoli TaxID=2509675 RepID=A0A4V0YYA2_KTERU|nr:hypothetical protein [Ktedonosporobacter rubrisoli]QBD75511.1 hypothetical protein EPA93_05635 [Ktedonosporobacter rubrisoli]